MAQRGYTARMTTITAIEGDIAHVIADTLIVNLFAGVIDPAGATGALDAALGGAISRAIAAGDVKGKPNEVTVLYPAPGTVGAARVIVVGLGAAESFTIERARQASGAAIRKARDLGAVHVATVLHGTGSGGLDVAAGAQALAEGTILALYRFTELKKPVPDRNEIADVTVIEHDTARLGAIEAGLARGRAIAESTTLARTLVNRPPNVLSPRALAEVARQVAAETGLRCEVLGRDDIAAHAMGALGAVAQGSHEPPAFIILEHVPAGVDPESAPVVLCGKGVTFDSGGISIKPSQGMGDMKGDMGGAAAVLGAMRALRLLDTPVRTIGLIPATENLPDGRAFRPGDVIRAMDGQTIEIISTDAEGRLILADAMVWAKRYAPVAMVDVATLTGACMVALGAKVAGVMGNADVVARLRTAGDATNERVWELPLWDDEYGKMIDSDVADMKNAGGRNGGAISAGKFLEKFAGDIPWAHVDMAGLELLEGDAGPYRPKGASGYGVRLLVAFVEGFATADASKG